MDDPSRIGPVLGALARGWGMESPLEAARLFAGWEQIVGPEVAAKCSPSSLRSGVLKVRTESAVWASEFRYLAPEVIERINLALGKRLVSEVRPWVKSEVRENGFAGRPKPFNQRGIRPSAECIEQARRTAAKIPDPKLAAAFQRAALAARFTQAEDPPMVYSRYPHGANKTPPHAGFRTLRRHL